MKKKRPMQLDELAAMVAKGFAETATKQDIKDMATKQDIKDMATKQDIKDMATKQDIAKIQDYISDIGARLIRVEMKLDRALYKEINRLEGLIRQLAKKTHVKLEF